ncbi:MAG: hypothetical protein E6R07_05190 [Nevskiaceae bacterium]|nr:MAG: hypothetical protein E6R07_05190 [Nevskiaceae bacterium]
MTEPLRHPLIDTLLDDWRAALGKDDEGYRNHCHILLNVVDALAQPTDRERELIAIAAAFHDLGIWSDHSFDYLDPSAARARAWLAAQGREADAPVVEAMIQGHHQFTRCRGPHARLAEAFRRADWNFVSLGLLPMGVPRTLRRRLVRAFPNAGFHAKLLRLIGREFMRRPWRPLPMMRW